MSDEDFKRKALEAARKTIREGSCLYDFHKVPEKALEWLFLSGSFWARDTKDRGKGEDPYEAIHGD